MSNNDLRCNQCKGQHHPADDCMTETKKASELKPCPFCGGKEIDIVIAEPIQSGMRWIGYGVCKECLCRGGWFEGLGFNAKLAKKIVADNWNRRTS